MVLFLKNLLARVLGSEYEEYRARVGRWLPRIGN